MMCARSIPMPGARISCAASMPTSTSLWCVAAAIWRSSRRSRRAGRGRRPTAGASACGPAWRSRTARPSPPTTSCSRFDRARAPGSKIAGLLAAVREVRKIDDRTVEIVTNGPDPLLLDELAGWAIMSRAWCVAHDAAAPADLARSEENYAGDSCRRHRSLHAWSSASPDERTVLVPNPHWWDKPEHNLDRVVFTPLDDPQALAAGLIDGALDMIYAVPPQEFDRIAARRPACASSKGRSCARSSWASTRAATRSCDSDVKGRNPFKRPPRAPGGHASPSTSRDHRQGDARPRDAGGAPGRARRRRLRCARSTRRPPLRSRGRARAPGRGRISQRLRDRHGLPDRPLRQ